jgi:glyoxylase-like metal-dependent hydrolase (beta-lactamase superfamily II)
MSLQLGRWSADIVSGGTFTLDGGAMFGIIPRPLWSKKFQPDEANGIRLATNVLLLRDGDRTILVDTGMGQKWSPRHVEIFGIDPGPLEDNLAALGVKREDVTDLFLTHLHFDHAGGATRRKDDGELEATFPSARVHVGRRNWEWAHAPTERDRGSYRAENWSPFEGDDRLVLHDDDGGSLREVFPEFDVIACEGHTTGQLLPYVGAGDQRALYGADMLPTTAHVRVAWHMGYDLRPLDVMSEKRKLLDLVARDGAKVIFEHDPDVPVASIVVDEGERGRDYRAEGGRHG